MNFGIISVLFEIPEVLGMLLGHPVLQRRVGLTLGMILGAKWIPKGLILGLLGSILAPFRVPFGGPWAPEHAS